MRFPQLHFQTGGSTLETCDVVCSSADPRDLDAISYALKRGYSIDWEAAKRYWSHNPIADAQKFNNLLTVWPSALKILCQEGPYCDALLSNIRTLLRNRDTSLAQRCLLLDSTKPLEQLADDSSWPPFIASWQLYVTLAAVCVFAAGFDWLCACTAGIEPSPSIYWHRCHSMTGRVARWTCSAYCCGGRRSLGSTSWMWRRHHGPGRIYSRRTLCCVRAI